MIALKIPVDTVAVPASEPLARRIRHILSGYSILIVNHISRPVHIIPHPSPNARYRRPGASVSSASDASQVELATGPFA